MRVWFVVLLVALGTPPTLFAQVASSLTGIVTDGTSAVIPGATVQVTNVETGFTRSLVTDEAGRYRAVNLPLGDYEVRAELTGFRTVVRRGIRLNVGAEVAVNLTLELGDLSEEVLVTAEAPLVETTRGTISGLVEQSQIANLPLSGRSFTDLALLQPGVTLSATAGTSLNRGTGLKISIGGSRQTQVNYTLDGSDINDNFSQVGSVSGRVLGVDAIREFRVVTSPFSAEYAKASGGEVQIVTRSGTNNFHGSLFEFHRNSAFNSPDFFDQGEEPPPFKMNQYGGGLGGPIATDRTFFFTAYEGLRESLTTTRNTRVPDENVHRGFAPAANGALTNFGVHPLIAPYLALYPLPNGAVHGNGTGDFVWTGNQHTREHYAMGRVDHRISEKQSFYGRYVIDDGRSTAPTNMGLSEALQWNRTQYVSLGLDSVLSARAVNAVQFSFNRSFLAGDDYAVEERTASLLSFSRDMAIPPLMAGINPGGGVAGITSSSSSPEKFANNLWQLKDDLSLQRGGHGLKMGVNLQRVFENYDAAFNRQPGVYDFGQLRDFLRASANTYTSTLPGADSARSLSKWVGGVYIQDDWRIKSRLTLNLGLRYEFNTVPKEKHGRTAQLRNSEDPNATMNDIVIGDPMFKNPTLKSFGPRVAFAWDVTGDGKTAVRGGGGVFYDPIQWLAYRVTWNRVPPFHIWGSARTATVGPIDFPNAYLTQSHFLRSAPATETIQYDIGQPTILRYALAVQRELGPGLLLDVHYAASRGYDMIAVKDINQRVPQVQSDGRLFFGPNAPIFNPNMDRIRIRASDSELWYNAIIVGFRQRLRNRLQYQVSYTLAKAEDLGSNLAGASDFDNEGADPIRVTPPGFLTREDNRGLAAFDVRQTLVFNWSYEPPAPASGLGHVLLGGWSINGIGRLVGGSPFTPGGTRASSGRTVRTWGDVTGGVPDLVPGANPNPVRSQNYNQYFDPTAFALPAPGYFGDLGRNTVIGPGVASVDLSVFKENALPLLGSQRKVQFRVEVFNVLNRANFSLPSRTVFDPSGEISPTAGRITNTSSRAREWQLGLKFLF